MVQGLNMKTVTVRETLKQTLKASFPGPSAMRKDKPAKSFRPPRPNTWASSYFQLPTPHAQTTQESCLSPFILCLLATLLFMPSPCLTPFLPAVTVSWLLPSGGFREQLQSSGVAQAGGDGDGIRRVCGPRNCNHFYLVSRQSQRCPRCFLANVSTDGFNFFPSPSLLGSPRPPAHSLAIGSVNILWKIWFVLFSFARLFIIFSSFTQSIFIYWETLRPVRWRQSHRPDTLRNLTPSQPGQSIPHCKVSQGPPHSRPLVCPAPTVVVAFYLCPGMFFRLHSPPIALVMAARKRGTFSLFKKTQEESGNVTEESWLDRRRSRVLWKF